MKDVKVSEVMTRDVVAVAPDTGLETAARLMANRRVSGVPVVEENGHPVGVVALMDLVDPDQRSSDDQGYSTYYTVTDGKLVAAGGAISAGDGCVRDVMTPYVFSVDGDADVKEAAAQMTEYNIHRLLVMEGEKLVGIVSSLDMLRGMLRKIS